MSYAHGKFSSNKQLQCFATFRKTGLIHTSPLPHKNEREDS